MRKVTAVEYEHDKDRYTVVSGHTEDAPRCSAGNILTWVGFDKQEKVYVRFTKSVFLRLVRDKVSP